MKIEDYQRQLQELNLIVRRLQEEAELRIPPVNEIIAQVAAVGLANQTVILGDVMTELPYSTADGPYDSGQLLLAVLVVPGGLGVARWDSEEYWQATQAPEPPGADLWLRFRPFSELVAIEKALLLLHAAPLVERLCRVVLPAVRPCNREPLRTPPGAPRRHHA